MFFCFAAGGGGGGRAPLLLCILRCAVPPSEQAHAPYPVAQPGDAQVPRTAAPEHAPTAVPGPSWPLW